jgi:hypothetical protein
MAKKRSRSAGRRRSGKMSHRAAWIGGLAVAGAAVAGAAIYMTEKKANAATPQSLPQPSPTPTPQPVSNPPPSGGGVPASSGGAANSGGDTNTTPTSGG